MAKKRKTDGPPKGVIRRKTGNRDKTGRSVGIDGTFHELHTSPAHVSRIMRGSITPRPRTAERIAQALNADAGKLFRD